MHSRGIYSRRKRYFSYLDLNISINSDDSKMKIFKPTCLNLSTYNFVGKAYKMFDDQYMEFDNATEHCTGLAAR